MAANNFLFDLRDAKFILKEWLDTDALFACDAYKDYYSVNDVDSILDVAFKLSRDVISPVNEDADNIGLKFENGQVITPNSFKKAYAKVIAAELGPQVADREMEGHMPMVINAPVLEMMTGASAAFVTFWCLTQGAANVIQTQASEELKQKFLPKMFSGDWGGTMNLTEPGAGSDVGAVVTRAYPTDTVGLYKIKGTKMFITAGDHDVCDNFIHLVLARVEGAIEGTAGLSLFIVPKFWVNDDGSLGKPNDVTTVGIEHKLGLRGSPTCTLAFGEEDSCYGYIIGKVPSMDGKGKGMAQMFQMMNEERLNTGVFALAVTGQAYYNALAYTKERIQGTSFTNPKGPKVRIIDHEDIRRMLMLQKSCVEAVRALIYKTFYYIDMSHDSSDPAVREYADAMFLMNNPLCKAYASDLAWPLIGDAIQTYGGYGFIEEYPCAQLARDCKIYSIWEGTNYIQSQDLVGRKFIMGDGRWQKRWLDEIYEFVNENRKVPGLEKHVSMLGEAFEAFQCILVLLRDYVSNGRIRLQPLFSTRILHATSMVYCGKLLLEQALVAKQKLDELGEDHFDAKFYKGKIASAKFYIMNVVPQIFAIRRMFEAADMTAIEIDEESFG